MSRRFAGTIVQCLLASFALTTVVSAQGTDTRRAQATRAELEATLAEIEQVLNSPGYSGRLKAARRSEAELLRQRLSEGDMQVGDQINLTVIGEPNFTNVFTVAAGRVLILPGLPEIPLKGVLRSEVQDHVTRQLSAYIRNPDVRAQTLIRLSFFGAVGKPGFYQLPAEYLAGDAIMSAGGPTSNADSRKTVVRRGGTEIWDRDSFQEAMVRGLTLDQLNLRAGDEVYVGEKSNFSVLKVVPIVSGVATLTFLILRVF